MPPRNGHPSLGPSPPVGLSSRLGGISSRTGSAPACLRLGFGEVLRVLGRLSAYLQKGHYLRKHYLSKQPGSVCSSSPANRQHFHDENGKTEQEREALRLLDEPVLRRLLLLLTMSPGPLLLLINLNLTRKQSPRLGCDSCSAGPCWVSITL